MNRTSCLIILVALFSIAFCVEEKYYNPEYYFNSPGYIQQSASKKNDDLWNEMLKDTSNGGFYNKLKTGSVILKDAHHAFEHYGDELPSFASKLIHTSGVVAKAEITIYPNSPYSGIFKEGTTNAIIRLSVAAEYDSSKSTPEGAYDNFIPGMSMKIQRDGRPSANVVCMYSTSGQPSWNFFKNDFTNSFEAIDEVLAKKILGNHFAKTTKFVSSVGIKEFFTSTERGDVPSDQVKFPFRIALRPSDYVRSLFEDYFTEDYDKIIMRIPAGTKLWDILAYETPSCEPEIIGELKNTTKFTHSYFGDYRYFIRHQFVEEDDKVPSHRGFEEYRSIFSRGFVSVSFKEPKVASIKKCPFGFR